MEDNRKLTSFSIEDILNKEDKVKVLMPPPIYFAFPVIQHTDYFKSTVHKFTDYPKNNMSDDNEEPDNIKGKRKGGQIRFSYLQSTQLEKVFAAKKYLTPEQRRLLADELLLSDRQVKTWFQNRRAKLRRTAKNIMKNDPVISQALENLEKTDYDNGGDDSELEKLLTMGNIKKEVENNIIQMLLSSGEENELPFPKNTI